MTCVAFKPHLLFIMNEQQIELLEYITEKYENNLLNDLQNPDEAAEYLNAALEDGYPEVFLMALKDVVNAKGISKAGSARNPISE